MSDTSILPTSKWEKDLALSPNPDFWIQINKNIFSMTTNTNLQLIQYKTIHRIHITQGKMFKMGLINTDICSPWVTQMIIFPVTEKLLCIFGCRILASPWLCLLGDLTHITIPTKHKSPFLISLTIAKKILIYELIY